VSLYWQALTPPPADRYVYLRLVDSQGRVWAKTDAPPVMGLWPVTRWQPGQIIEDVHELPLPPGTPPGEYRLEVGWYDPQRVSLCLPPVSRRDRAAVCCWVKCRSAGSPYRRRRFARPHRYPPGSQRPPRGVRVAPATATTGDLLPLRLAWREAGSLLNLGAMPNNYALFEWRQNGQTVAPTEQLDPLPLPIEEWGRNALLLSQHEVIVPPTLAAGRYELTVRLHTGSDPAGEPFTLGSVQVDSPPHQFDLPKTALPPFGPAQLDQGVNLAGTPCSQKIQSLISPFTGKPKRP